MSNFAKTPPVESELFYADTDGRKDMRKLIVTFRNFAKAPEGYYK